MRGYRNKNAGARNGGGPAHPVLGGGEVLKVGVGRRQGRPRANLLHEPPQPPP